jgi:hypothetical protein
MSDFSIDNCTTSIQDLGRKQESLYSITYVGVKQLRGKKISSRVTTDLAD